LPIRISVASSTVGALLVCAWTAIAIAQPYPTRPVRIVVAFPAGGGNDIIARFFSARLTPRLGQQVVIDNRGGASGIIGTEIVARAAPDGYTLLFTSLTHSMNEAITKLPYDTLKSFTPVSMLGRGTNVLVVNPALPVRTLAEFIALAKAKPKQLNYGSTGVAGMHHFGGEMFKRAAGIDITHVPFKGGGPAQIAVMAGEVDMMFSTLPLALPHIRTGRLRPLAVGSLTRSPLLPDLPTLNESGAPGYEFTVFWGIVAPIGTPAAIVQRLNKEFNAILSDPEASKQLATEGAEVTPWTPAQFGALLENNVAMWKRVAREANIKAE
jgi:tripartite-type tricarboxylate transporter receptor subunit TctC